MKLQFTALGVDSIDCELLVVGCSEEERPIRGAAGLIDWRLHGLLSRTTMANQFSAQRNESILVPATHRLSAKWVLFIGLGSNLDLHAQQIHDFGERAVKAAKQLNVTRCAVYYPNVLTQPPFYQNAVKWLLEGLSQGAAAVDDAAYLSQLTLLVPSKQDEEVDLAKIMLPKLLGRHAIAPNQEFI